MSIDRIDRIYTGNGPLIRMIDYKTGQDATRFGSVASLLNFTLESHIGGIFQTILYAAAWSDITGDHTTPVQPLIYKVTKIGKDNGIMPIEQGIKEGKKTVYMPLVDFRAIEGEFRQEFNKKVNEIFDSNVDFMPRADKSEKNCQYCEFKRFCGFE